MAQIAEDVACGFQCSECGICFERVHGHPVLCHDCFDTSVDEMGRKPEIPRATQPEM